MHGAALGLPIQLLARLSGAVNWTPARSVVAGVVAGTALISAVAPFIVEASVDEDVAQQPGFIGSMIDSLVTFMDLNAEYVELNERKRLAVVDLPGRDGDWIQDMGTKSVVYRLKGRFFAIDAFQIGLQTSPLSILFQGLMGDAAIGNIQLLRAIQRSGVPIPFLNRMEISEVLIHTFKPSQVGGKPNWIYYDMTLIEYRRLPTLLKMGALAASHIKDLL